MKDLLKMLIGSALYAIPMGLLLASKPPQAPIPPQAPAPQWGAWLLPEKAERYEPTTVTQSIYTTNGFSVHHVDQVPISGLEAKWHQSGGMLGVKGVVSVKYKLLPKAPRSWVDDIAILNGSGDYQNNRGIKREYADGTRFDDVLSHEGKVFEHRVREKRSGKWKSSVIWTDEAARPAGYTGLTVDCASCHKQAGTGSYGSGLVPGGDTVLSDPLDWRLVR